MPSCAFAVQTLEGISPSPSSRLLLLLLSHKSIQLGLSDASASIYRAVPVKAGLRLGWEAVAQAAVCGPEKDPTLQQLEVI